MMRVLIGVLAFGKHHYCLDNLLTCLRSQTAQADRIFIINNESAYAALLRSKQEKVIETKEPGLKALQKYALENKYDYLLIVDNAVMIGVLGIKMHNAGNQTKLENSRINPYERTDDVAVNWR